MYHQNSVIDPIRCIPVSVILRVQMEGINQVTIQEVLLQQRRFNELLVQDQLPC